VHAVSGSLEQPDIVVLSLFFPTGEAQNGLGLHIVTMPKVSQYKQAAQAISKDQNAVFCPVCSAALLADPFPSATSHSSLNAENRIN
jgi:hypothetical protein